VRTDNATGLTKARYVSGSVTNDVEVTQEIARDAASRLRWFSPATALRAR